MSTCLNSCGPDVVVKIGDVAPLYFKVEVMSCAVDLSDVVAAVLLLKREACGCDPGGEPVEWAVDVTEVSPGYVLLRHVMQEGEADAPAMWSVVPRLTTLSGARYLGSAFSLQVVDPWHTL